MIILSPQYKLAESEWKKRYGTDYPLEPRWIGRENEPYKYKGYPSQNKQNEARLLFEAAVAKRPFSSVSAYNGQPDPFSIAAGLPDNNISAGHPVQKPGQPTVLPLGPVHDQNVDVILAAYRTWRANEFAAYPGVSQPPTQEMSMSQILAWAEAARKSEAIQKLLPAATLKLDEDMKQVQVLPMHRLEGGGGRTGYFGGSGSGGIIGGRGGVGTGGTRASGRGGTGASGQGGRSSLTKEDRDQIRKHRLDQQLQKANDVVDMYNEILRQKLQQPSPQDQLAQLIALRDRMVKDGANKATIMKMNQEVGKRARDYHRYFEA